MLKTVLKVIIFYAILSVIVSGCSLIGEYAEGFDGMASNGTPTKVEIETTKEHNENTKPRLLNISFIINESICKEPLIKRNGAKYIVPSGAVITFYKDLPKDLIQTALTELKKRKKFYTIDDMRGITLFSLMVENETYFDDERQPTCVFHKDKAGLTINI